MRMLIARIFLIFWLAFSVKQDDDLYGTLMSIRRMAECRRLTTIKRNNKLEKC
jgi:hypothetical protein